MARGTLELATKNDLQKLQAGVNKRIDRLDTKIDQVQHRLETKMDQWKDEIIRHFDLTVETIRHDLVGANRDEINTIKDRLVRLERHTGIIAA